MKYLVASDIHGSEYYCKQLLEAFDREQADRLLLLGDILYHGPRNGIPEGYNPREVTRMLNERADSILCVRGNCDAEVDQLMLDFPIMAEYAILCIGEEVVYATHGHNFGEGNPPKLKKGDILLCGHTHIPKCKEYENYTYMNPGSVSMPKEDTPHGYMIMDENGFVWKDLEGNIIKM